MFRTALAFSLTAATVLGGPVPKRRSYEEDDECDPETSSSSYSYTYSHSASIPYGTGYSPSSSGHPTVTVPPYPTWSGYSTGGYSGSSSTAYSNSTYTYHSSVYSSYTSKYSSTTDDECPPEPTDSYSSSATSYSYPPGSTYSYSYTTTSYTYPPESTYSYSDTTTSYTYPPESTYSYSTEAIYSSTTTYSAYTPTPTDEDCPPEDTPIAGTGTFYPSATYNYDVSTGAIECSPSTNKIFKSYSNYGHDLTTLLTFEYPAEAEGKMCQFGFRLEDTDVLTGSMLFDLFSSLNPAPGCTATWPPGNQRNEHLARLQGVAGGDATYVDKFTTYLTEPSPCKSAGTIEAFELVGVYDNVDIEWNPALSGPYITYL